MNNFLFVFIGLFLFISSARAEVIFHDDYDRIGDNGWNCAGAIREGYTSRTAGCDPEAINGALHYRGEISPGGRSGNSFKIYRHNGLGAYDAGGYLNKNFTQAEFDNKYREIYVRWYVKISPEWDTTLGSAQSYKFNRMWTKTEWAGSPISTIYYNVKGATFKEGRFSFNATKGGGTYYLAKTVNELGINDGNWHSLEWHFKMNTDTGIADGQFHFYVDGVNQAIIGPGLSGAPLHPEGVVNAPFNYPADEYLYSLHSPAIGNLTSGWWTFPTDDWYAFEFDDYAVSTSYIGPVSEQDETPPVAPGNLKVR